MSLKKTFKDFIERLQPVESSNEPHCQQALESHLLNLSRVFAIIATAYHIIALIMERLVLESDLAILMRLPHYLILAILPSLFYVERKRPNLHKWVVYILTPVAVLPIAYGMHFTLLKEGLSQQTFLFANAYIVSAAFSLVLAPARPLFVGALGLVFILAGAGAVWTAPFDTAIWLVMLVCTSIFGCGLNYAMVNRVYREADREFKDRLRLSEMVLEKYNRELDLARSIQDSAAPPQHDLIGSMAVRFVQSRHNMVGGDWMGFRKLPSGGFIAAVADANGNGIRAALAIHALQTLWVESLSDPEFQVGQWLERVNKTLFDLGKTDTHAIRLGVVGIEGDRLSYWSAGHLPLFIIYESLDQVERAILKPYPGLGYQKYCHIEPSVVTLDSTESVNILLGTDGVFPKGTLTNRKDMSKVLSLLKRLGDRAMDKIPTEDDKSVVWFNGKAA